MYNSAFEAFSLPHKYLTLQNSSLRDLKGLVQDNTFGGASITAPFKQEILSVLDYLSQSSRAIGAVNTLIPLRSGGLGGLLARSETGPIVALYGDNTDWIGIFNCVRQHLSPVNAIRSNTTALVIGAGGMAHACVYSMIRLGIQTIFVCNRTAKRAQELADRFSGKTYSTDHTSVDDHSVRDVSEVPVYGPADVRIISSIDSAWPIAFDPPTVIVSCVPSAAQNGSARLAIPDHWLANNTGGVLIDVRLTIPVVFWLTIYAAFV
jgi:shikimate 5-dehydrogenase